MYRPTEDKYYSTKNEMYYEIIRLLGGRVAEKLVLDDISSGASNDIERASKIARQMVTKYGMSDAIGPINYGSDSNEVFIGRDFAHSKNFSEKVAAEIDDEVRKIINDCYNKCLELIKNNLDKLEHIAKVLLDREEISGEEFEIVFNGGNLPEISFEITSEEKTAETVSEASAQIQVDSLPNEQPDTDNNQ